MLIPPEPSEAVWCSSTSSDAGVVTDTRVRSVSVVLVMIPKAEVIPSSAALTQGSVTVTGASSAAGCPPPASESAAPAAGSSSAAPELAPPQAAIRAVAGIAARDSRARRRERPEGLDVEARWAVDDGAQERSVRVVRRDARDMNGPSCQLTRWPGKACERVEHGWGCARSGTGRTRAPERRSAGIARALGEPARARPPEHREHRRGAVTAMCAGEQSVVLGRTRTCTTRGDAWVGAYGATGLRGYGRAVGTWA